MFSPSSSVSSVSSFSSLATANRATKTPRDGKNNDYTGISSASVTTIGTTSSSPPKLPKFTEVYTSAPYAAGVPILELIKKLEDEKSLNREDRLALNAALYDPDRREKITKALRDVELGANPKFALRKLKVLMYQNRAGEVSVKSMQKVAELQAQISHGGGAGEGGGNPDLLGNNNSNSNNNSNQNNGNSYSNRVNPMVGALDRPLTIDEPKPEIVCPKSKVSEIVGHKPMYDGPGNDNILSKIAERLREYRIKLKLKDGDTLKNRKFAVIIGGGSFNPLTRMHMRSYFLAKQELESKHGFIVLGSLLSPAHASTVLSRYKTNAQEILPSPHRLAISQLMVQDSKWLSIDPWEITRRRSMDYLATLEHTAEMLRDQFPTTEIKVLYLCKSSMTPLLSPVALKAQGFAAVTVCRAPDSDYLRETLSSKWNGAIYVVEDTAILDASMDIITSRKVRDKMRARGSISQLVGDLVEHYVMSHDIGAKMNGLLEWTDNEKLLPKIISRKAGPTLKNRINMATLQEALQDAEAENLLIKEDIESPSSIVDNDDSIAEDCSENVALNSQSELSPRLYTKTNNSSNNDISNSNHSNHNSTYNSNINGHNNSNSNNNNNNNKENANNVAMLPILNNNIKVPPIKKSKSTPHNPNPTTSPRGDNSNNHMHHGGNSNSNYNNNSSSSINHDNNNNHLNHHHLPTLQRQGLGLLPGKPMMLKDVQRVNYNNPAGFVSQQQWLETFQQQQQQLHNQQQQLLLQQQQLQAMQAKKPLQPLKPMMPINSTSHNHSYTSAPNVEEISVGYLPSWQANYRHHNSNRAIVVPQHAKLVAKDGAVRRYEE